MSTYPKYMDSTGHGAMNINDRDFDATLRNHHAQALASMSARTQAQLQLRRRAATTPARHSSMRAFAWPLAVACRRRRPGRRIAVAPARHLDPASASSVAASSAHGGCDCQTRR